MDTAKPVRRIVTVDDEKGKTEMDCMNMPLLQKDFARMARYGKSGLRAALIIYNREERKR